MPGKPPTCFMQGARIRAARGEVPVEAITTEDEVIVLRDGSATSERVKWVGYAHIDLARHPRPEEAAPVRIRKGAIADGQPAADLVVSPEHCLIIDGLCVPAKLLVNGGSVVSERGERAFTYYHLELDRHGVLLAENTQVESYLDTGNRGWFDNCDDPRQLHPDFVVNSESTRWSTDACAPLAKVPDEVEPIWCRVAERSAQLGFPVPTPLTVDKAELHVVADDRVIRPVVDSDERYVFAIPAGVSSVSLISRFSIPADRMVPGQRDTRRLGVRVHGISIQTASGRFDLPADHPALEEGWNEPEADGETIWRWTDGAAKIPWTDVADAAVLTVRCVPMDEYLVYDQYAQLVA